MNRNCRRPDSWNYRLRAMKLGGGWRPLTALSLTVALLVLLMPWAAEAQGTNEEQQQLINVSEPSDGDLPGNTTTTGFVTIGGTVSGNVGEGGDGDWYGVELTEGAYYKFSLHGTAMANSQVTLRGLADENGSYVTPTPVWAYRWSSIYWKPSRTGTFYLDVGPYQDERNGAYELSASLIETAEDAIPAGTTTTAKVDVGGSLLYAIQTAHDHDWIKVDFEEGVRYRVVLDVVTQPGRRGWADMFYPALVHIRDPDGDPIANTSNVYDVGVGLPTWWRQDRAETYYRAAVSGTHYIVAGSSVSTTGIFGVWVVRTMDDDYSGNESTTGMVTVGGAAASGKIEVAGDKDWFKTSLTEGETYKVNVLGKSTGDGSLRWPKLTGIYNSSGERFPNTENYDHGFGLNPRKYFTASHTGDYFIGVTGHGRGLGVPSLGTYKVLLEKVDPDIPGDITTTASLTIDGTVTSEFDRINDDDWHKLEVEADQPYTITMSGGGCSCVYIRNIYDSTGNVVTDLGSGLTKPDNNTSQWYFKRTEVGTYYVSVGECSHPDGQGGYDLSTPTGTYTVTVISVSEDATLSGLTLSGIDLESFASDVETYTATVTNNQTETTVTPMVNDSGATYVIKIDGVTDSDGTVTLAAGNNLITVKVTAEDGVTKKTYKVTVTRAASQQTQTVGPGITGSPTVGETVTADTSEIEDANGLINASFSYQWERQDLVTEDVTDIPGATGATYEVTSDDRDSAIRVSVSYTDDGGNNVTLTSFWVLMITPPNNLPTGAPTISGAAQVGETLTADTSDIGDDDGLTNVAFSYQWLANDGTSDTDIAGETDSSYTLAASDEGKTIKVRVSFTDDAANEETLTSAATSEVVAAGAPTDPPGRPHNLTGAANADGTVTLSWDAPNDDSVTGYQILRRRPREGERTLLVHVNDTGSTATEYTDNDVTPDVLHAYRVKAINAVGLSRQSNFVNVTPAQPAEPAQNSPATGTPTINGTAQVGQTLTADTSGIADADGLSGATFSYQWVANDGTADTDITDATDSTYTLAAADEGRTVKVKVSFTDDAGNDETLTSSATAAVDAAPNTPATGAPTISGTAQVGETLTADTSGISDADGLADATFAYQWLADGTGIAGATGDAYILTTSEMGKIIKVRVSFTDDAGNEETLTSTATGTVSPAVQPQTANSSATGVPTVTGTAQVGETLSVDTSGIADADGLTNVSYSYRWVANDEGTDANISSETDATYTLVAADVGDTIKVKVTFTDDAGNEEALTSGATDAVAAADPPAMPTGLSPSVSHDAVTLTWDDPQDDSITGYVILRRDRAIHPTGTFVTITGDTGSADTTYTDETVEPDKEYVYRIKAINEHGQVSEMSDWRRIDTPSIPVPDKPTGLSAVVSYNTVTITWDDPQDDSITGYVILRRDRAIHAVGTFVTIAGDTGSADTAYTDDTVEPDREYVYRIKAINEHGEVSEMSDWVRGFTPAAPPTDSPATGEPTISGTVRVGQTLTVDTSGIADADGLNNAVFAYQWLSDDADIGGATGSTYTLVDDDEGRTIKVRVTVTDDVGNETTLTSAATEAVEAVEAKRNTAATGRPIISGTVRVGETLTADTTGIGDADGLANVSYSYQWVVTDGGAYIDISGETGATYTLASADRGLYILVRVSFADDAGKRETLTSAATDMVEAAP